MTLSRSSLVRLFLQLDDHLHSLRTPNRASRINLQVSHFFHSHRLIGTSSNPSDDMSKRSNRVCSYPKISVLTLRLVTDKLIRSSGGLPLPLTREHLQFALRPSGRLYRDSDRIAPTESTEFHVAWDRGCRSLHFSEASFRNPVLKLSAEMDRKHGLFLQLDWDVSHQVSF